jgi:type II secretory pathway pseudopilin PulG
MLAKIGVGIGAAALLFSVYNSVQLSTAKAEMEEQLSQLRLQVQSGVKVQSGTTEIANNQGVTPVKMDGQPTDLGTIGNQSLVPAGPLTAIKFKEEVHHFGTVQEESENLYSFTFTNTGKEPLIIQDAKGSCGCTVPNFPKQPIMPGKTGTIDVKFTPYKGQIGPAEKTVTVTANTDPSTTIVKIQANVVEKK